jgi:hypothetical protein
MNGTLALVLAIVGAVIAFGFYLMYKEKHR